MATRDFSDVDVAALDASLAQRLEWAKNRIDLPAGRYEALLPPTAVSDLMIYLYWKAGARDALEAIFQRVAGRLLPARRPRPATAPSAARASERKKPATATLP